MVTVCLKPSECKLLVIVLLWVLLRYTAVHIALPLPRFYFLQYKPFLIKHRAVRGRKKVFVILGCNLLNNGLCACGVQRRWKSNKFILEENFSVSNAQPFPLKPLKYSWYKTLSEILYQMKVTGIALHPVACAVICFIPSSFCIIFMINMIDILHYEYHIGWLHSVYDIGCFWCVITKTM